MLDANLTGIIIVGIIALMSTTIVAIDTLSKTKLKIEQIRADALVKAEEVKAKNQIEIEKLLYKQSDNNISDKHFESDDMRQVREKKEELNS